MIISSLLFFISGFVGCLLIGWRKKHGEKKSENFFVDLFSLMIERANINNSYKLEKTHLPKEKISQEGNE